MAEVLTWLVISGIVFLFSIVCFFISIVRKKFTILYISLFLLFSSVCIGLYSVYLLFSKTRNQVGNYLKPRTGAQIYKALFGESFVNCLNVKNYKDQVVPKLDCCIWLEFKTCPPEFKRILKQKNYKRLVKPSKAIGLSGSSETESPQWWHPERLGDTVIVLSYEEPNRWITIFASKDSSLVFYNDMAD